eukprot:s3181_g4.t1
MQQKKQKEEEAVQEIDPNLVELGAEFQAGDVKVPDTFPEMCLFNAAVMGYSNSPLTAVFLGDVGFL